MVFARICKRVHVIPLPRYVLKQGVDAFVLLRILILNRRNSTFQSRQVRTFTFRAIIVKVGAKIWNRHLSYLASKITEYIVRISHCCDLLLVCHFSITHNVYYLLVELCCNLYVTI